LTKSIFFFFLSSILLISCDKQGGENVLQPNSSNVNQKIALKIAQSFFKKENKTGKGINNTKTIDNIILHKTAKNENAFYVINYKEGGFLIISADNRISPILAFSETDKFDTNLTKTPEPVIDWMESKKEQVQYIIDHNLKQNKNIALEWNKATTQYNGTVQKQQPKSITGRIDPDPITCTDVYITKGPLMITKWDQWGNCFNNLIPYDCPYNPGGKAPTGCVATAMAQVMRYFQKPNTYNWSNMPATYGTSDTQLLMKNAGAAVGMQYSCDGSGAKNSNIPAALINSFRYSNASYTTTYNSTIITNNIDANKPVILGGFPSSGSGHSWVCDGYQRNTYYDTDSQGNCTGYATTTLYLYMNWGWHGSDNGYYAYDNFKLSDGTSFNNNRSIVYNITL